MTEEVVTDVTNKLHEQNELNVRAVETSTSHVMPYLESAITFVSFVALMIGALAAAVLVSPVVLVYLCARGFDTAKQMIDKRFDLCYNGGVRCEKKRFGGWRFGKMDLPARIFE